MNMLASAPPWQVSTEIHPLSHGSSMFVHPTNLQNHGDSSPMYLYVASECGAGWQGAYWSAPVIKPTDGEAVVRAALGGVNSGATPKRPDVSAMGPSSEAALKRPSQLPSYSSCACCYLLSLRLL